MRANIRPDQHQAEDKTMSVVFQRVLVAEEYARHRGEVDEEFFDHLAELLRPARVVVDVGAGVGAPAQALARRGLSVVAVEPSGAMIRAGRARHPQVRFVQALGEALPLPDRSVDAATLLYVLHHVLDPPAVLREARRVVRPWGPVVVVSGKADCRRQRFFRRYFPTLTPELPEPQEIGGWAEEAGLPVVDVLTLVHWLYRSRTIDAEYLDMVENEMFAALRALNEAEFEEGLERLRADAGLPLPPPEVTVTVLQVPPDTG